MERSQRSGHCCPELCPPYSSNGNEPRTTVLYGNNSASVTTRSPPFFFFCSIPSLYISLPSKLLNVGLHVEAAHLKQAKKHIRESGENRRESTSTGPTLQPVTFSVMYTAHIWCTMAEQPLPPNHFKQNWPRFGYSCRAAVSCAGWGGTVCISLCEPVFFF